MLTDWESHWDKLWQLHDELGRTLEDRVFGARFMPMFVRRHVAFPKINLLENPAHYVVTCELPGVSSDALEVSVTGRELTIKGERPAPEGTDRRYDRHERGHGPFSRTIELPGPVETDNLSASLKHGVLTVQLARTQQDKPRQVQVKANEE